MPYTTREAIATLSTYLGINLGVSVRSIDQTSNRGYEIRLPSGERCVIFVYPISHKQDDSKNFFDTRDSGARERGIAWNYAQTRNLKYFCLAVHDQVEKYKDYIFSLECDEHRIAEVSGTLNGSRNGRGTQVVIPTSCVPSKGFERIYTDNGFYIAVIHKDHIYEYLEQYDNRPYMDKTLPLVDTTEVENDNSVPTPTQSPFSPTQIIYYGVPGCGKSHTVDAEINKSISEYNKGRDESDKISYEKQVVRVVFHPDYGNSDFIGQIMPKLRERGGVDYVFKPGPLAQILRMAYLNSDKPYFLVVEEINRGNAAAIFGETFQLLDRIKDGKKDKNGYGPGWSSYSILNDDVNDYIRDIKAYENFEHSGCVKTNHPKDMINGDGNPVDAPNVNGHKEIDFSTATSYCSLELILQGFDCSQTFRESTAIRLPPNLSIYATMNTSDQNVFTLDNAFQRRWEMKQIPNELKNTGDAAEVAQYNQVIKNGVSWGDFRKAVNEVIMDSAQANGLSSMEDKRLGGWFFTPPDNFAEKVLKYLWDDAFKFDRPNQFTGFKTLEELVTNFNTAGFKVFKDDRISKLQKDSSTTPNGSAQNDTPVVDG